MPKTSTRNIDVHAVADITVQATSTNGGVRVTADPRTNPDVHANSVNGRVRTPR